MASVPGGRVSRVVRGGVIVMNVAHHPLFKDRSGLGTSTRRTALTLWRAGKLPALDNEKTAKLLFGAENPPGTAYGLLIVMRVV